jgi:spore coat polysaccharide biosynthesis protein SpsF (cytidylyltransferase family)
MEKKKAMVHVTIEKQLETEIQRLRTENSLFKQRLATSTTTTSNSFVSSSSNANDITVFSKV